MESWQLFWAVRAANPHLIAADGRNAIEGHTHLGVTSSGGAGIGFAMDNLYKRGIVRTEPQHRVRPNPPLGTHGVRANLPNDDGGRTLKVWWLAFDALVPQQAPAAAVAEI